MKPVFLLAMLASSAAPVDHPRSYLLSIVDLPVKDTESVESFAVETWGVEFKSVCAIPKGWRINAGSSLTPNGNLNGEGSQGVTWFNRGNPKELRRFVLITLYDKVQRDDIKDSGGEIPATFKGSFTLGTDAGEEKRPLDYRNIRLTPARRCPRN